MPARLFRVFGLIPIGLCFLALLLLTRPAHADWTSGIRTAPTAPALCQYQFSIIGPPYSDGHWLSITSSQDEYGNPTAYCNGTATDAYGTFAYSVPIKPTCTGALVSDANVLSGCSAPGGIQPLKSIGAGTRSLQCPLHCHSDDASKGADPGGSVKAGDPIDVGSGNVYLTTTDYTTAGQNPLTLTRYYNSRGYFAGMLGSNWRTQYEASFIIIDSTRLLVQRPDGQTMKFTYAGSLTWTSDTDVDYTLTNVGPVLTLTCPDDTVETYTDNAAGTGSYLTSIKKRNGYTQTLTYTGGFL